MTTRLDANNIAAGSITTNLIANNAVTLDKLPAGMFGPRITSVVLPGGLLAISPAGGETVVINGSGFGPGVQVYFGSLLAPVITRISSTQLNVITPVMNPSTYTLYVTNTDGGTAIRLLAITVSTAPVWAIDSVLPTQSQNISVQLSAVSDSSVIYTLASGSSLPPGVSLSTTGLLFGTFIGTALLSTYNFTVIATDLESQTNSRSFSVSISLVDSNFYNVPLLLQTGAVSARSTTVVDSSTNNFTVTRNGAPSTGWISPYQTDGYWGNYFNGSTDYLDVAASTAFNLTGSFTVECWFYLTAPPANNNDGSPFACLVNYWTSVVAQTGWEFNIRTGASGIIGFSRPGGTGTVAITASYTTFALNTWYHVAVTYNGTTGAIYLNGTALTPTTNAWSWAAPSSPTLRIGRGFSTGYLHYFPGYISNLRITNGTVVYTGTFTPPVVPLTATQSAGTNIAAITGTATSLLTCQSNRFRDNSTNNFTITPTGTPQVTPYFYPSGFTAPAASPGAALFNGSTDNLSVASNAAFAFGTSDYTFECWVNSSATAQQVLFTSGGTGTNNFYFSFAPASSYIGVGTQSVFILQGSNSLSLNVWYHVAASRASGTLKLFLNGVQVASGADGTNWIQGGSTSVGNNSQGSQYFSGYISNLRVVKGTAVYTGNFTPPTTPLTAITNTSLLVNLSDSNYTSATNAVQNNTFIDSGPYAFPITRVGTPTQGSITPYWPNGQWSNYLNGSSFINFATLNAYLTTGACTIEAWVNCSSFAGTPTIVGNSNWYLGENSGWTFHINTNGTIALLASVGAGGSFPTVITTTSAITLNTWNHVAFVRNASNVCRIYINGTDGGGSVTYASAFNLNSGAGFRGTEIGTRVLDGTRYQPYTGYVSNLRIINNVAVYTGTFIPPTAPLTATQSAGTNIAAITGAATVLLTCQSNRFRDNSNTNYAATITGTPQVQAFQPFSPAAAYTAAAYGGSGYFNGTTDYLSTPSNFSGMTFGTGAFCVEVWLYPFSTVANAGVIIWNTYASDSRVGIQYYAGTGIGIATGAAWQLFTSSVPTPNQWTHLVINRNSSGAMSIYFNGVRQTTTTNSGNFTSGLTYNVGKNDSYLFNGYMSNLRIVVGNSVYDPTLTTLTVSTAPVTAITNTSFLLNFTNAAIYDAAVQNNVITVGDAQASTTVSKWSPTSMRFDGTVDALSIPSSTAFGLGTGDWTIEFWLYLNAATQQTILSMLTTAASVAPHIYYQSASGIRYYTNSADRITGGALTTGVWNYIAVTKASGTTRMYINGTQTGSNYTDGNNYGTTNPFIVGNYGVPLSADSTLNGYVQDVRITKGVARTIGTPGGAFPTR